MHGGAAPPPAPHAGHAAPCRVRFQHKPVRAVPCLSPTAGTWGVKLLPSPGRTLARPAYPALSMQGLQASRAPLTSTSTSPMPPASAMPPAADHARHQPCQHFQETHARLHTSPTRAQGPLGTLLLVRAAAVAARGLCARQAWLQHAASRPLLPRACMHAAPTQISSARLQWLRVQRRFTHVWPHRPRNALPVSGAQGGGRHQRRRALCHLSAAACAQAPGVEAD